MTFRVSMVSPPPLIPRDQVDILDMLDILTPLYSTAAATIVACAARLVTVTAGRDRTARAVVTAVTAGTEGYSAS